MFAPSDFSKLTPVSPLLDATEGNFQIFQINFIEVIEGRFGGPATAIITDIDYQVIPPYPTRDNLDEDYGPDNPRLKYPREIPQDAPHSLSAAECRLVFTLVFTLHSSGASPPSPISMSSLCMNGWAVLPVLCDSVSGRSLARFVVLTRLGPPQGG